MSNTLQLEMRFGSRSLLRENWLCERMIRDLRRHETMTEEEIGALEAASLHRTLVSAISKLPYYQRIPSRFPVAQAAEVLRQHIPIIDKETLLQNRSRLYPHSGRPALWNSIGKTSGTAGTALPVFRNPQSVLMENAFIRRHWEWGGFQRGMRYAALRGDMIVTADRADPPFWFRNRYDNQLLISSRHLREACVDAIIEELERFAPEMLQAYPSTAFALALFMEQRNCHLSIPIVFTASEPLYPHQRELIEERFGARVMDMFGTAERVVFATECEFESMHVNPDYSLCRTGRCRWAADSRRRLRRRDQVSQSRDAAGALQTFGPHPLDIRHMPLRPALPDDRAGYRENWSTAFSAAMGPSSARPRSLSHSKDCAISANPRSRRSVPNTGRCGWFRPLRSALMIGRSSSTTSANWSIPE